MAKNRCVASNFELHDFVGIGSASPFEPLSSTGCIFWVHQFKFIGGYRLADMLSLGQRKINVKWRTFSGPPYWPWLVEHHQVKYHALNLSGVAINHKFIVPHILLEIDCRRDVGLKYFQCFINFWDNIKTMGLLFFVSADGQNLFDKIFGLVSSGYHISNIVEFNRCYGKLHLLSASLSFRLPPPIAW